MQKITGIKFYLLALLLLVFCLTSLGFALAKDEDSPTNYSTSSSDVIIGPEGNEIKTTTDISTETVIQKDSDGDGLLDEQDPHPNIPEIYIVTDDNRNGIVDQFEK
jgi:hypothetical protein